MFIMRTLLLSLIVVVAGQVNAQDHQPMCWYYDSGEETLEVFWREGYTPPEDLRRLRGIAIPFTSREERRRFQLETGEEIPQNHTRKGRFRANDQIPLEGCIEIVER